MVSLPCIIWVPLWRRDHETKNIQTFLKQNSFWNWREVRGSRTQSTPTLCHLSKIDLNEQRWPTGHNVGAWGAEKRWWADVARQATSDLSEVALLTACVFQALLLGSRNVAKTGHSSTLEELLGWCLYGTLCPHLELSWLWDMAPWLEHAPSPQHFHWPQRQELHVFYLCTPNI